MNRAVKYIWVTTFSVLALLLFVAGPTSSAQRGLPAGASGPDARQRRVALVIGNAEYKKSPLRNPVNDAKLMAATLKQLGFEVITGYNLNLSGMKRAVRSFGKQLDRGGVGLFYYAGHGVQVKGLNYLIPISAQIDSVFDVELEALDVRRVLVEMAEAHNRLNLVFLDACRNNPYARSFRSASNGLAQMDAPSGTLIAFATGPGSVAADGKGSHGVFTEELARNMTVPGLMVESVLKHTRKAVSARTGGKQVPWDSSSLTGDFYFNQDAQAQVAVGPEPGDVDPQRSKQGVRPREELANDTGKRIVQSLLLQAEADFAAKRLTTPAGNNACEKYKKVLRLDPINQEANAGLRRIVFRYVDLAKGRIKAGDYKRADNYLARAEMVSEGDDLVLAAWDELKEAKATAKIVDTKAEAIAEADKKRKAEEQLRAAEDRKERAAEQARKENEYNKAFKVVKRSSDGRYILHANHVITDTFTNLQWFWGRRSQDWYEAKEWVKNLEIDGRNWRMPNLQELCSLTNQEGDFQPLYHSPHLMWSSNTSSPTGAWGVKPDGIRVGGGSIRIGACKKIKFSRKYDNGICAVAVRPRR